MLGDNIRSIRKQRKMSINKLSKITGISLGYLSDLENSNALNPTMDKLNSIASALNVEVDEFLKSDPVSEKRIKEWNESVLKEIEAENAARLEMIPEEFVDPNQARTYINKHKIFASEGFDVKRLSDDDVLEFANALLEQMKMVSYKYKK